MDLKLENQLALVSGSTAGIGLAIAAPLAREERKSSSMAALRRPQLPARILATSRAVMLEGLAPKRAVT